MAHSFARLAILNSNVVAWKRVRLQTLFCFLLIRCCFARLTLPAFVEASFKGALSFLADEVGLGFSAFF